MAISNAAYFIDPRNGNQQAVALYTDGSTAIWDRLPANARQAAAIGLTSIAIKFCTAAISGTITQAGRHRLIHDFGCNCTIGVIRCRSIKH